MVGSGCRPHRGAVRTSQPSDTVFDLGALRRHGERAIASTAAAPVRHVTPAFLAALNGRDEIAPGPLRDVVAG